jgi:hypothetical protein
LAGLSSTDFFRIIGGIGKDQKRFDAMKAGMATVGPYADYEIMRRA